MLSATLKTRLGIFLTITLVSSILITSCSKAKGPVYESPETPGVTPALGEAIFPHKTGWAEPESHGKSVRVDGVTSTSACAASCHGENLEGGIGPSCKKCHENYPHADGWENKDNHGKFVVANGKSKCATKCHGSDLSGGLSGIACENCHSIYPHEAGFSAPESHGAVSTGDKKELCIVCHGSDWKGSDTAASCISCHKGLYPHSEGWSKKENHGAYVSANSKEACATKCHGTDLAGGLSGVSCDACHTLWPSEHKKGTWQTTGHGIKFLGLGKGACLGCHGEDWKGGKTGYSCMAAGCHQSLPQHYEDGLWKEINHVKYALTLNGDYTECKKCHGENLEGKVFGEIGIKDIPACSNCHESYPYKHTALWKTTFGGHGAYLLAEKKADAAALDECKKCHGAKLDGGGVGKSCYTCHATFPHLETWNVEHGTYYIANEKNKDTKTCATANCHGINLKGNPEGVAIDQKLVYGCEDCHLKYPHPQDWKHGLADPTFKSCKTCHGANFEGKGVAPSCNNDNVACHKSFPSPHRETPYEIASATWKKYEGHGDYTATTDADGNITVNIEACKKCHGALYTGGSPGSNIKLSCYACHKPYPHPPANEYQYDAAGKKVYPFTDPAKWAGFDGGHGLYLAYKAKKSTTGKTASELAKAGSGGVLCANCHGDDFTGGVSGKSCKKSGCHPSYPHAYDGTWKQNAADPAKAHGGYLMSGLQNLKDVYVKIQNECSSAYCHGSEGVTNWKAPDCNDSTCHATFPTAHAEEAMWPTKDWHGDAAKTQIDSCKLCHGNDFSGGNINKPCSSCHAVIDAHFDMDNWKKGIHGTEVLIDDDKYDLFSYENYTTKCQYCHGEIYPLTDDWPAVPPDGLAKPSTCYNCHPTYPHYEYKSENTLYGWSKVNNISKFAHFNYLAKNVHFTDGVDTLSDILKNCGGDTDGYCHNNIRQKKDYKTGKTSNKCNVLCHSKK